MSDRIGRKPIILSGCLIAALTFFPAFKLLTQVANPALYAAQKTAVTVTADPANCSFLFNPVGTAKFTNSCDIVKALLSKTSVNSLTIAAGPGAVASVKVGDAEIPAYDGVQNAADIAAAKKAVEEAKAGVDAAGMEGLTAAEKALGAAKTAAGDAEKALKAAADDAAKTTAQAALDAANAAIVPAEAALDAARAAIPADALAKLDAAKADLAKATGVAGAFTGAVNKALAAAGYPLVAADNTTIAKVGGFFDFFKVQNLSVIAILTYFIILVMMVWGPIAAMLVELYPNRIRYSGLSLPYHIGNGWFGGLLPATAFAISAQAGNIYAGLWYAVIVAGATVVIGTILVPNGTHKKSIFTED